MRNNKISVFELTLMGFCIALNMAGSFIALTLKLPIYMDSIGTILIAALLGGKYAIITGISSSLVSGMTFDIYSLYFAPVQITTGYFSAMMFNKNLLNGIKTFIGTLMFSIPTSIVSATIAAYVFGGITSSGSSYIVQILSTFNIPIVVSVFITQIITDYGDKLFAVLIVLAILKVIPKDIKVKLKHSNIRR